MITISLCTSFLFLLDIFAILRKPSLTFFDSDNDIALFILEFSELFNHFIDLYWDLFWFLFLSLTTAKLTLPLQTVKRSKDNCHF